MLTVEVKHTHQTDPVSRGDVPFVEVNADHVVRKITNSLGNTETIVLKCEATNKTKLCTNFCAWYDDMYEHYYETLYEEYRHRSYNGVLWFKGRRLCTLCKFGALSGSYNVCYVCSVALNDERKGTNKAEPLLNERWEKMKQTGLVHVADDGGWVKGITGGKIVEVSWG
jgi:hypothetical protein